MARDPKNPNIFTRSTKIKCVAGRCKGSIMHQRTQESVHGHGPTVYGKKYPEQYVDTYFCSGGCGLVYEKPSRYRPPQIVDWDDELSPALAALSERQRQILNSRR